jgi:hypothetical protein
MNGQFLQRIWEALPSLIGLTVAVTVLIWSVVRIRTYFREESDTGGSGEFLLTNLRELKQKGDLSEEEFRKLKSQYMTRDSESGKSPLKRSAEPTDEEG